MGGVNACDSTAQLPNSDKVSNFESPTAEGSIGGGRGVCIGMGGLGVLMGAYWGQRDIHRRSKKLKKASLEEGTDPILKLIT